MIQPQTAATGSAAALVLDPITTRGRLLTPVLVFIGLLVAVVSSLGAPLVPAIATDYGVSLGTAQWSLTITLLVGAVTAPIVGRLGDGPRRLHVLVAALCIFVAGSVLAALPTNLFGLLLAGRAGQGIGLSLLPLVMGIARDHLQPQRARRTLATLSVTAVAGVGLGYPLTGLISEHLNFHTGFWFAASFGVIAIGLVIFTVPTSRHRRPVHLDVVGGVGLGGGVAGVLLAISEGEDWGWMNPALWALGLGSVVVLAAFVRHELRTSAPIVDLRLMRHRAVLTANVTAVFAGVGMYMLLSMIIRYVQTPASTGYGLGESVVVGGFVLLALSVGSLLASRCVAMTARWVRPERMVPVGVLAFVLALLLFALRRHELWEIFLEMGIAGIGIGCSFAVMPRLIVGSAAPEETSSALALNQVLRTLGYSIGSAVAATVLTANTPQGSRFPLDHGYLVGALIALGLCLGTAAVAWVLPISRRTPLQTADADQDLMISEGMDAAIAGVLAFEPDLNRDRPARVES